MNKSTLLMTLAVGTAAALIPETAWAVPKTYEIGPFSTVAAQADDPGLTISTKMVSDLAGKGFTLDDGDSYTFDFFKIWTTESSVNDSDDKAPKPIVATLDFSIPDEQAVFSGVTFGGTITWLFVLNTHYAKVVWDGPVVLDIPGDRTFTITLGDTVFNSGLYGLGDKGAKVQATLYQESSQFVSVPDSGGTLWLMGGALLCVAAVFARTRTGRTRAHAEERPLDPK